MPINDQDERMFVPEDDMQGVTEEISPGNITTIWVPPIEHIMHDVEMGSPCPKRFGDALRAFSAVFNKPRNMRPKLPCFTFRGAAPRSGTYEDVTMHDDPDAQARSSQIPKKSLEFEELAYRPPEPVLRPVAPGPGVSTASRSSRLWDSRCHSRHSSPLCQGPCQSVA